MDLLKSLFILLAVLSQLLCTLCQLHVYMYTYTYTVLMHSDRLGVFVYYSSHILLQFLDLVTDVITI